MRKSINQQFTVIELDKLLESITKLLNEDFTNIRSSLPLKNYIFTSDNLIEFSILMGTDYASFNLKHMFTDPIDMLKYYMFNGLESLLKIEDFEKFNTIKEYYQNKNFTNLYANTNENTYNNILEKPEWNKPKLMELKLLLLSLGVDEDYIDKNNELFDFYFNKYNKKQYINKNTDIDIFQDINDYNGFKKYNKNYSSPPNSIIDDDFEALTESLSSNIIEKFDKKYVDTVLEYENFINNIDIKNINNFHKNTRPITISKKYNNIQKIYLSNSYPDNNYYKPKNRFRSNSNNNIFDI
jgi:hypothetical protein